MYSGDLQHTSWDADMLTYSRQGTETRTLIFSGVYSESENQRLFWGECVLTSAADQDLYWMVDLGFNFYYNLQPPTPSVSCLTCYLLHVLLVILLATESLKCPDIGHFLSIRLYHQIIFPFKEPKKFFKVSLIVWPLLFSISTLIWSEKQADQIHALVKGRLLENI